MLVEVSVYMRPRIFLAFFLIEAMCVDRIAGEFILLALLQMYSKWLLQLRSDKTHAKYL